MCATCLVLHQPGLSALSGPSLDPDVQNFPLNLRVSMKLECYFFFHFYETFTTFHERGDAFKLLVGLDASRLEAERAALFVSPSKATLFSKNIYGLFEPIGFFFLLCFHLWRRFCCKPWKRLDRLEFPPRWFAESPWKRAHCSPSQHANPGKMEFWNCKKVDKMSSLHPKRMFRGRLGKARVCQMLPKEIQRKIVISILN